MNLAFDILEFQDCPSLDFVTEVLSENEIQKTIATKTNSKILGLVFDISEDFTEKDLDDLKIGKMRRRDEDDFEQNSNVCERRMEVDDIELTTMLPKLTFEGSGAMLIAFRSMNSGNSRIYWKIPNAEYFIHFNLMECHDRNLEIEVLDSPEIPRPLNICLGSMIELSDFIITFLMVELEDKNSGEEIIFLK